MGTIIIMAIIVIAFTASVRHVKKKGTCSGCSSCGLQGQCGGKCSGAEHQKSTL